MAEVKSAKQKIAEEQRQAAAQAPGLHPKEPCNGCEEKKEQGKKKKEKKSKSELAEIAKAAQRYHNDMEV